MEQQREILQARARFRLVSTQRMFADRERPSIQRFDRVVVSQGLEQSSEVIDDRSRVLMIGTQGVLAYRKRLPE
jgi:hypothetical protein